MHPPTTTQVRIVRHAFEIISLLTDQNPIQVLVDAIINRCGRAAAACRRMHALAAAPPLMQCARSHGHLRQQLPHLP